VSVSESVQASLLHVLQLEVHNLEFILMLSFNNNYAVSNSMSFL